MEINQIHSSHQLLFIRIINSKVIRKKVFECVKTIHRHLQLYSYGWNELLLHPKQLLLRNYIERYKEACTVIFSPGFPKSPHNVLQKEYVEVLSYIHLNGNVDLLDYIYRGVKGTKQFFNFQKILHLAFHHGDLEIIRYLHEKKIKVLFSNFDIENAAKYGYFEIVKFLHENRTESCTTLAMNNAAERNHLEIVKFLHFNRKEGCTTYALDQAVNAGKMEMVRFLHENSTEGCTTDAMNRAALNGNMEMVRFLHENRTEGCTTDAMDFSAMKDNLEMVRFLHDNRTEGCTTDAMNNAALNGNMEMVRFLHENRTEGCTTKAMDNASMKGHLDIVKFLHFNRSEGCTVNAMNRAAQYGHIEVVKWLNENNKKCTFEAIDFCLNHFEMQMNRDFISLEERETLKNRQFEVVKYLFENRTEGCSVSAINSVCCSGDLDLLEYLSTNPATSDYWSTVQMDLAAENEHLNLVEWLDKNRTEGCTTEAADYANNLSIVKYLLENRTEGCTSNIFNWAMYAKNSSGFDMEPLKYLASKKITTLSDHSSPPSREIHVLEFLYDNQIGNWTLDLIESAANQGRLDIIKRLVMCGRSNFFNYTRYAAFNAIIGRQLEVLKYLKEQFPILDYIGNKHSERAAYCGHMDILHWFYDNHIPISDEAISEAACQGHLEIVIWLDKINMEKNNTFYNFSDRVFNNCFLLNSMDVLLYILENQFTMEKAIETALLKGKLTMAKSLIEINNNGNHKIKNPIETKKKKQFNLILESLNSLLK